MVRPDTIIGLPAPAPLIAPGFDVTVYSVMADPPLLAGGVKFTVTCPFPPITDPIVGAPGTVTGVTEADGEDAAPAPTVFEAVTVKV